MLTDLQHRLPGQRSDLSRDPVMVLQDWSEVDFRSIAEREASSGCSVAGAYYAVSTPPIIAVVEALSGARRAFSALHELGHHLQQSDFDLAAAVDAHGTKGTQFEDVACDAFAAEVLLPTAETAAYLPAGGPSAPDVAALHRAFAASRAAVCVRAAQHLKSPGHVVLLDQDGTVQFAAAHLLPPVPRGFQQEASPLVRRALEEGGRARGRVQFSYRDGIRGDDLYAQAAPVDGGYTVVVAVTEHPPWEDTFTPPLASTGPVAPTWTCPHSGCGEEYSTFTRPCPRCATPTCPHCQRCTCIPAVKEQRCTSCFLVHPASYFDGDRCLDCA